MRALARNLLSGLRLFAFLPVEPTRFAPSARQAILLARLALGAWTALDRLEAKSGGELGWVTVQHVVAGGAPLGASLIPVAPRQPGAATAWATAVASALPFLVLLFAAVDHVASEAWHATGLALAWGAAVVHRA